jgi:hypothetical protein
MGGYTDMVPAEARLGLNDVKAWLRKPSSEAGRSPACVR